MMENYVGLVKERLDRSGESIDVVDEAYSTAGPLHGLIHKCSITYHGFHYEGLGGSKKDAKQAAYCRLWEFLAPVQPALLPTAALQVRAMRGDKILGMIVTEHFASADGITPVTLQNQVVQHTNNTFLFERYAALAAAQALPDGLPPPAGLANVDPTTFEAWVVECFEGNEGAPLAVTAAPVLHALGLS